MSSGKGTTEVEPVIVEGSSGDVFARDAERAVVSEWGGMYQDGAVVVGADKPAVGA